jgi:hypothetical protein
MILQGITGDSKMTTPNPLTGGWIRDMQTDIEVISAKITADILRALPFSAPLEPAFRLATKSIRLPFWRGLGRDLPTAEAMTMLSNQKTLASWKRLLTGRTIPYEIQVLAFANDYRWVILGGEPCTDLGRRVKAAFTTGQTYSMGYCNHMPCYLPSRRIAVEGGYEGRTSFPWFGQPHPLHPDCEDLIAAAVETLKNLPQIQDNRR